MAERNGSTCAGSRVWRGSRSATMRSSATDAQLERPAASTSTSSRSARHRERRGDRAGDRVAQRRRAPTSLVPVPRARRGAWPARRSRSSGFSAYPRSSPRPSDGSGSRWRPRDRARGQRPRDLGARDRRDADPARRRGRRTPRRVPDAHPRADARAARAASTRGSRPAKRCRWPVCRRRSRTTCA